MVESHKNVREGLERDAMRLLCSELIDAETRERLAGLLQGYAFVDILNGAVYEAIVETGPVTPRRLPELLPGRVTNLGFADFDLKEYLGQSGGEEDLDKLLESLLDLTELPPEETKKALGQSA
jgi:hypothetical protein